MSVISMFAVVNGALIQIIMASRVSYGLSRQNWLPRWLGKVHPRTRTPIYATVLISVLVIIVSLWLPIETLARASSYFLLLTFALVNLSLWRIKCAKKEGNDLFLVPLPVPVCGFFGCVIFLLLQSLISLA